VVGPDTPREEIGLLMAGITPDTATSTDGTSGTPGGAAAPAPEGPGNEEKA